MNRIRLLAMVLGLAVVTSTSAVAVPAFPQPLAPMQAQHLLVQYGGDDDDDDRPRGGGGGGNYGGGGGGGHHRHGGGSGIGGVVIQELLRGGMQIMQQENQRRQRERANQDHNRRNQEQRNNRQRDQALEQERRKQKQQQNARDQKLKQEQARKNQLDRQRDLARDEELKLLREQNAQNDKKRQQEDAIRKEDELQKQRDLAAQNGNEPNPYDDDVVPDKLENGTPIKKTVQPADDRPELDDIPVLPINRNTQLPACGYVNLPPDRELCSGRTASGGWLRIRQRADDERRPPVRVPRILSGQAEDHAARGGDPLKAPDHRAEDWRLEKRIETEKKPTTPAVRTVKSQDYVEPPSKRPPATPAVQTVKANDTIEPEPKRPPPTPAVQTVKANDTVEPEPKRPPATPAVQTVKANDTVEPEPKRPPATPAVQTVKANDTIEPETKRPPTTPAVQTVKANDTVEPETKRPPTTPAVQTVKANDTVEPETKRPTPTPAVATVKASDTVESKNDSPVKPAVQTAKAEPTVEPDSGAELDEFAFNKPLPPGPKTDPWLLDPILHPTLNLGADAQERMRKLDEDNKKNEAAKKQREAAEKKKKDDDDKRRNALLNPGPVDAKNCTVNGSKPADHLVKAFPVRELVIGLVSAIPAAATEGIPVGAILGGAMKFFWKDDGPDQLFNQMKAYVDNLVPASLDQYDKTQLQNDLEAIRKIFANYNDYHTISTKGDELSKLVTQLELMQPHFLNRRSPQTTLAELVAFGTLKLAALQELVNHYDRYRPVDPTKPDAVIDHDHDRNVVINNLNDSIKSVLGQRQEGEGRDHCGSAQQGAGGYA